MEEWFISVASKFTPGAAGIWVLVAMAAIAWWKGLPPVLDAWSNSVSKERDHREREIERLERQIKSADDRHDECLEGQRKLREEIASMQKLISGLVMQLRQLQLSSVSTGSNPPMPPALATILAELDKPLS